VAEDPDAALCDGPQQLYARDFGAFAKGVADHAALEGMKLA
jgi:3-deoxy-D-arabino-heptulosonate 7-phosphate (DAHP) synthase